MQFVPNLPQAACLGLQIRQRLLNHQWTHLEQVQLAARDGKFQIQSTTLEQPFQFPAQGNDPIQRHWWRWRIQTFELVKRL